MITMTIVQSITITLGMSFHTFALTAYQPGPPSLEDTSTLLNVLNDIDTAWNDRLAAFERLMQAEDVRSLNLLYSIIDAPISASSAGIISVPEDPDAAVSPFAVLSATTGAPKFELESDRPPGVQVVLARKHLWNHWVRSLGAPDDRAAVIAQLLYNPTTEFQLRLLVEASYDNWNPLIERWMLDALSDPRRECEFRYSVAKTLVHRVNKDNEHLNAHIIDAVNTEAWRARAGPCSHRFRDTVWGNPGDPRAMVLTMDRYLAARANGASGLTEALYLASTLEFCSGRRPSRDRSPTMMRALGGDGQAQAEVLHQTDAWVAENERSLRLQAEAM